jgi:phosphatidate cytidylyltransferase
MDDAVPSGGRLGRGGIFSSRDTSTEPDLSAVDPAQDGGPIDLIPAASAGGPDDRGADQTGPAGLGDDLADRFATVAGEVAPRFQQSPVVDIREPAGEQAGPGDQPDPTTALPHWTEPPTGEVPAVFAADKGDQEDDDLDAWSSFAGSSPRWRDSDDDWDEERFDDLASMPGDDLRVGALDDARPTHDEVFSFADLEREANTGRTRIVDPYADPELDREPPDLTFGQPGEARYPDVYGAEVSDDGPLEGRRRRRRERKRRRASEMYDDEAVHDPESPLTPEPDPVPRGPRPRRRAAQDPPNGGQVPGTGAGGPDWGMRIAVGVGLVAVLSIAFAIGPPVALALVTAVLGLAALEFFNTLRTVGYQPAVFPGLVATVLMPIAVYNADGGPSAALGTMALVLTMTVLFGLLWYLVGADGGTGRVVEGLGLTLLGVGWIGMLGSFVAVMLRFEHGRGMVLAAIIVTVAYDVGGLVVGRSAGADGHPLSAVSPNKTREGLAGGVLMILFVGVLIIGFLPGIEPFDGFGNALKLCLLAVLAAPLGDLCESLVKRDLGVKDMGTLLPAHGGLLDRIDGLLFVMPATYFCMVLFDLGPFAG